MCRQAAGDVGGAGQARFRAKVASYNRFSEWCRFGNHGVIAANDPEEQEKILSSGAGDPLD